VVRPSVTTSSLSSNISSTNLALVDIEFEDGWMGSWTRRVSTALLKPLGTRGSQGHEDFIPREESKRSGEIAKPGQRGEALVLVSLGQKWAHNSSTDCPVLP